MKMIWLSSMVALGSACAEQPNSISSASLLTTTRIATEAQFVEQVAGRQITVIGDGFSATSVINPSGTMSFVVRDGDGALINRGEGEWEWRDGRFCRQIRVVEGAPTNAPESECQELSLDGRVLTIESPALGATDWIIVTGR